MCSEEYGTPEVAEQLGLPFEVPEGTYNCVSGIVGPDGAWVTPPLVDQSGIVYADCSFEAVLHGKLFHDIVGHYNRFDVLQLQIDRTERGPLKDVIGCWSRTGGLDIEQSPSMGGIAIGYTVDRLAGRIACTASRTPERSNEAERGVRGRAHSVW